MFEFRIEGEQGSARAGLLELPSGTVHTPAFMPVGTRASVKTLSRDELIECGAEIVLANTYHLYLRPGHDLIATMGGVREFMSWPRPVLTDSGGFQVFSLRVHRSIDDDGVTFRSHIDGSSHRFTPERTVEIQRALGADVIMVLDDCPPGQAGREEARTAHERTLRWTERAWKHFATTSRHIDRQTLLPIAQGSTFADLRRDAVRRIREIGDWSGIAIGGLSVGEPKETMLEVLDAIRPELPREWPRYVMGVGYPDDLIEAIGRGYDMFDCVAPTRNGRNGTVWVRDEGHINIKAARYRTDPGPLDPACDCSACRTYSRAYIRHLFIAGEMLAMRMMSLHNVRFLVALAERARSEVLAGTFGAWSDNWLARYRAGVARRETRH